MQARVQARVHRATTPAPRATSRSSTRRQPSPRTMRSFSSALQPLSTFPTQNTFRAESQPTRSPHTRTPTGPPQTAEEYLQWVRYEAAQCPRVTRKDVDPEKLASSKRQAQDQNPDSADAAGDGTSEPGSSGAAASGDGAGGGGGGGGSGGGASRGRRRGTAFAAQVPPPVDAECQDWARPNPKWLTVFLQVRGLGAGGWGLGVGDLDVWYESVAGRGVA